MIQAQKQGIFLCDSQRFGGNIRSRNSRTGNLGGQSQGNCAASRADIQNTRLIKRLSLNDGESFLNDYFRVGPGNQHVRIDLQRKCPESFSTGDIGYRFKA